MYLKKDLKMLDCFVLLKEQMINLLLLRKWLRL